MPYNITKSDGTTLTSIADGAKDQSTSLTLAGPNYVGYGKELVQNLVYLLENFASNSVPGYTNLQGQLWFDKYNQVLKVFTTQGYVPVNGVTNSTSVPVTGKNGDIWYNSSAEQLYIFDDTGTNAGFKLVGPSYTKSQGPTGAFGLVLEDGNSSGLYHKVIKLQFNNEIYAVINPDQGFPPTPGLPGFPYVYSGLTFTSNVTNPQIVTNVIGNVVGSLSGNVTGNVVATTLSGSLTGNVVGNLTGNVVATTLSGNLTGNVNATTVYTTNFSVGNIVVSNGYIQNLTNVSASVSNFTTTNMTTAHATNFSSGNAQITGGTATGLTQASAATLQTNNFSSGNAQITGGTVTGLINLTAVTAQANNFSSANSQITGGSVTGLVNLNSITAQATNFSSANAIITSGSATGLSAVSATGITVTNLSASNVIIGSGSISSATGTGLNITNSGVFNSVATTTSASDKTAAIATTQFVHDVLPSGVIVMWGGSVASIPAGWNLCDGTNGTPDLRNLFIVGAGGSYAVGATGGSNNVTLTTSNMPTHDHGYSITGNTTTAGAHNHTITDPAHSHSGASSFTTDTISEYFGGGSTPVLSTASPGVTGTQTTGISLGVHSGHQHTVNLSGNVTSTGGGTAHENRPPYYALCYIQKVY